MAIITRIQNSVLDSAGELAALQAADANAGSGALVSFQGVVRAAGGVQRLYLEHYPGMTERALGGLAESAQQRWQLSGVLLVHRVGWMEPGALIVLAATLAPHRQSAFAACSFLVDALKTDIPLWKKELLADGAERWVQSRVTDLAARTEWGDQET